jgi:hypothetical protein
MFASATRRMRVTGSLRHHHDRPASIPFPFPLLPSLLLSQLSIIFITANNAKTYNSVRSILQANGDEDEAKSAAGLGQQMKCLPSFLGVLEAKF